MSFVYWVQPEDGGNIKIGCSHRPVDRLASLLAWSPVPLRLVATAPGDRATEAYVHFRMREHRAHSEWFRPAEAVLELMNAVRQSGANSNLPAATWPKTAFMSPDGSIRSRVGDHRARAGMSVDELAAEMNIKPAVVRMNERDWAPPSHCFAGRFLAVMEGRGIKIDMTSLISPPASSDSRGVVT